MTSEYLLKHGYKSYPHNLFQKCIFSDTGKRRYFIDISRFALPDGWVHWTPSMQATLPDGRSVAIEAVQWYNTDQTCLDSALVPDTHRIEDVEAFFERAFVALGFVNYSDDN